MRPIVSCLIAHFLLYVHIFPVHCSDSILYQRCIWENIFVFVFENAVKSTHCQKQNKFHTPHLCGWLQTALCLFRTSRSDLLHKLQSSMTGTMNLFPVVILCFLFRECWHRPSPRLPVRLLLIYVCVYSTKFGKIKQPKILPVPLVMSNYAQRIPSQLQCGACLGRNSHSRRRSQCLKHIKPSLGFLSSCPSFLSPHHGKLRWELKNGLDVFWAQVFSERLQWGVNGVLEQYSLWRRRLRADSADPRCTDHTDPGRHKKKIICSQHERDPCTLPCVLIYTLNSTRPSTNPFCRARAFRHLDVSTCTSSPQQNSSCMLLGFLGCAVFADPKSRCFLPGWF